MGHSQSCMGTEASYTGLAGAEDVLQAPVPTTDLGIHPSSFITSAALSTGANIPDELFPSPCCPFLFSNRAGEGTTPHIHCDTNFTPTQGHSGGVMENAGGCQRQTKRQRQNMLPRPWE